VHLQIWDTPGNNKKQSLKDCKDAVAVIVVFDVTRKKSLVEAGRWINDVKKNSQQDCIIALVGTKTDLQNLREVSTNDLI
jgi:GTPase SAR1 family protein